MTCSRAKEAHTECSLTWMTITIAALTNCGEYKKAPDVSTSGAIDIISQSNNTCSEQFTCSVYESRITSQNTGDKCQVASDPLNSVSLSRAACEYVPWIPCVPSSTIHDLVHGYPYVQAYTHLTSKRYRH